MAKHEALFPLILVELPGCPDLTIRTAINRAAIEFCRKSKAWIEPLDPVGLTPGQAEYEIDLPAGSALVVIEEARIGDRVLTPAIEAQIHGSWGRGDGDPTSYACRTNGLLLLDKRPVERGAVSLTAALSPTLSATSLPDLLVDRHYEAICEGAKAILKRIPGQAWSDPAGAAAAYSLFADKTAEARIHVEHGFARGSMRVTARAFGS